MHDLDLIESDIETFLAKHETKKLLRFVTIGSVDDGKSTLIGRLSNAGWHHNHYSRRLVSINSVTGPSFCSDTCISAPNSPVCTG